MVVPTRSMAFLFVKNYKYEMLFCSWSVSISLAFEKLSLLGTIKIAMMNDTKIRAEKQAKVNPYPTNV